MAHLTFRDSKGIVWTVWSTVPTRSDALPPECRDGWLTFDCETGRRRLAPIPNGWEVAPIERLELMCRAAESVRRISPFGQLSVPPDDSGRESETTA